MSSHQEFKFQDDDSLLLTPQSVNKLETRTIELQCASAPITQNVNVLKFLLAMALWGLTIGLFFFNAIVATIVMAIAVFVTVRTKLTEAAERSSYFDFNHEGWTLRPWKGMPMSAKWEETKGFEIQQKSPDYGLLTLEDMDGNKIKAQIDFPHKSNKIRDFLEIIEKHVPDSRYRRYVFLKNYKQLLSISLVVLPLLPLAIQLLISAIRQRDIVFIALLFVLLLGAFTPIILSLRSSKNRDKKISEPVICNVIKSHTDYVSIEFVLCVFAGFGIFAALSSIEFPYILKMIVSISIPLLTVICYLIWKNAKYPYKMFLWDAYVTEGTLVLQDGRQTIREYICDLEVVPAKPLAGSSLLLVKGKSVTVFLNDSTDTDHSLTELIEGIKAGKTYPPKMSALHPGFNIKYNDVEEDGSK